ncbi:MAG: sodium:solute symporter family protein, partial [Acidilobaceae archaeon]
MEARALIGLTMLIAYILLGLAIAFYSRRFLKPGEVDFYIASRRLGGLVSALTYSATTYSAFMMVGLVGLTYATGVGAHGFELAYYIATLALLTYFAPRVWARARDRGWVSPAEALSDHYGSKLVGALTVLVYLVSLIPYTSIQVMGVGLVLSQLMGGEGYYVVGILLAAALIVAWSLIAGVWSVVLTDAFQGLWMLLAGLLYLAWLSTLVVGSLGLGGVTEILSERGLLGLTGFWSFHVFLAFTIPWVFFAMVHPQVVQRIYMPRDEGSLATMIRGFAVFGLLYTVLATLIGLLARAGAEAGVLPYVDPAKRDLVTPTLLSIANPVLSAIVFTSIAVAAITTADSIILSLASSMSRDLAYRLEERLRLVAG